MQIQIVCLLFVKLLNGQMVGFANPPQGLYEQKRFLNIDNRRNHKRKKSIFKRFKLQN